MAEEKKERLEFRGGMFMSLIPSKFIVIGVILSPRLNRPGWGHRRTKRTITKK